MYFFLQQEVVEHVKARLQKEGREARNLVAYSVPLEGFTSSSSSSSSVDQVLAGADKQTKCRATLEGNNSTLSGSCGTSNTTVLSGFSLNHNSEGSVSGNPRFLPHTIPECPSEDAPNTSCVPCLYVECSESIPRNSMAPLASPSSVASHTPLLSPTPSIMSSESIPRSHRLKVHGKLDLQCIL